MFKANGSYELPWWAILVSGNLNMNQGGSRTMTINGPGQVYGGVNATGAATTINYGNGSLEFQERGSTRFEDTAILDLGVQKIVTLPGNGRYRLKLMFDAFNVTNSNKITNYSSGNISLATSTAPSQIVPPRVYRVGASFTF